MKKKQALLVVSFGTSFPDSRRKAIDRLEEDLRQQCDSEADRKKRTDPYSIGGRSDAGYRRIRL